MSWILHSAFLLTLLFDQFFLENELGKNWLRIADIVLLCVLTVWYSLWFIICPSKRLFYIKKAHLFYLLLIVILWISEILFLIKMKQHRVVVLLMDIITALRATRVLAFIPLLDVWRPGRVLGKAIAGAWRDLVLVVVIISLLSAFFGYLTMIAEMPMVDSRFTRFRNTYWWAVVTITTVGYGDVIPVGIVGKVIASVFAICGVLLMSVPVVTIWRQYNLVWKREMYRDMMKKITNTKGNMSPSTTGQSTLTLTLDGVTVTFDTKSIGSGQDSVLFKLTSQQTSDMDCRFRDPNVLHCVLDYYNSGQLHLPDGCASLLKQELDFWGLSSTTVCSCCADKIGAGLCPCALTDSYVL